MLIIVQTQAHIFFDDRQLEFDGFQPLAIGLPVLVNLYLGDQRLHELAALGFVHAVIELFKVDEDLIDVVTGELLRLNRLLLGPRCNQQVFMARRIRPRIGETMAESKVQSMIQFSDCLAA